MAAEYSRELGVKCFAGQKRLALMGYRVGGPAGFGVRRMMVSPNGKTKQKLKGGEYKSLQTDRIILVPGPKKEVETVREIFNMVLRKRIPEIVRDLNAREVKYLEGRKWTYSGVRNILRNPKYCGTNAWGRTTQKLHKGRYLVASSDWITKPGAFTPIVDKQTFDRARAAHLRRKQKISDKKLLNGLKRLWAKHGRLSETLVDKDRKTCASATYVRHFGSIWRAFTLVGYQPSAKSMAMAKNLACTRQLREEILDRIDALFPNQVRRYRLPGSMRSVLQLDNGLSISVLLCRYYKTPSEGWIRWELLSFPKERELVTLLCLLNSKNDGFHGFYVLPRNEHDREYQLRGENDPCLRRGKRLATLAAFYDVASSFKEPNAPQARLAAVSS